MSFKKKSESQWVDALNRGRMNRTKIAPDGKRESKMEESQRGSQEEKMQPPPPPSLSAKEEEIALVKTLEPAKYDVNRQFPGLARQKIQKKARHMKALDEFTRFLDSLAGKIEQDVLRLSRKMKEDVEKVDRDLGGKYKLLKEENFLIPNSEDDLKDMLKDLKMTIAGRLNIVNAFGDDLDGLEIKRADQVGQRLKDLVDTLVSISHQLPDEIEHIAESQIFDLNTVLTTNRKSHSDLLGILRKTQVEVEIETLQRWEDGRKYWRQLRHDKGLADFTEDITSARFIAPTDRILFLDRFKGEQESRQERRLQQLGSLSELNADNINSVAVVSFQEECAVIADDEVDGLSNCYARLGELRQTLKDTAEHRVEELRKELHVYGALHLEPPFRNIAGAMQEALNDESLSELWRLGGGLKPDFTSLARDMCSVDLAYTDFVQSIDDRLQLICCGFNFKTVLEGRGRLMQLDKLRTMNMQLRTVSKLEVPGVIASLVPELGEVVEYEKLSDKFVSVLNATVAEMNAEVERVKSHPANLAATTGTMSGTGSMGETGASATTTKRSGTASNSTRGSKGSGTSAATVDPTMFVDQTMVKSWNRTLGILFFAADLSAAAQEACTTGVGYCTEQYECNRLVDAAVLEQSARELDVMDKKYKRLNDDIANFLEAQANYMAVCLTNIGTFFLDSAKSVEAHRAQQIALDAKSEDLLYELREDFRIEREDRETEYEAACQRMRESVSLEELQTNFEGVLEVLETVQGSYRTYHGNACFGSDKYPLSLANDFQAYLTEVAAKFCMQPKDEHEIIVEYNAVFDDTMRLNKKYFDADINAGGVPPRPTDLAAASVAGEGEEASVTGDGAGSVASKAASSSAPGDEGEDDVEGERSAPDDYISPLMAANSKCKSKDKTACLTGTFTVLKTLRDVTLDLTVDREDEEEEAAAAAAATASAGEEGGGGEEEGVPPKKAAPIPHPDCIFVRKTAEHMPKSAEEEAALDEYDLYDYEKSLVKSFIPQSEETVESLMGDEENESTKNLYEHCAARVTEIKARLAKEEDPIALRANVPMCAATVEGSGNSPWVLQFEIDLDIMQELVGGLRDSLVTSVEVEADARLKGAENTKVDNKQKLTDELEDRLRTHWPRRGRVETGIKQPREAELLGHSEKTYRHIESIHEKMIFIQRRFVDECDSTRKKCSGYVEKVEAMGEHLTGSSFSNLAVLQGIEVKARSLFLNFQTANTAQIKTLKRIALDEVNAVMQYAVDFKKVCPKQEPGVEGGYSEAELEEIEELVNGQCEEASSIQQEWEAEIEELVAEQTKSLEIHSQFTSKYEQKVQDVAMSEGLGQKYGAPRRRAQERIRSEVVRDEKSAGKIDEMIAKLEFICDEVKRAAELGDMESVVPGSVAPAAEDADNGYREMVKLKEAWGLLKAIRKATNERVKYLEIVEIALESPELPWLKERITRIDESIEGAMGEEEEEEEGAENEEGEFEAKPTKLSEVMESVDENCRRETRELYESEGMSEMLGEGGVPESLAAWLEESKNKILGRHGHREKAWKRMWAQIERFENVVGRVLDDQQEGEKAEKSNPDIPPPVPRNLPAPGACMRLVSDALIRNLTYSREVEEKRFSKVVKSFAQARDKHERLLRPRLGSPDAADELKELDDLEQGRSREFTESVINFRAELVRELVDQTVKFCEDLSLSSTTFVQYLDTSMRLEAMQLPPDTAVPKKRMTLKRLRKAQRLKAAIEAGAEDKSKERDWPAMPLEAVAKVVKASEDIALDAASSADGAEAPALLTAEWMDGVITGSVARGSVTTAHRSLMSERDAAVMAFSAALEEHFLEIRGTYAEILSAEESWIRRWGNQVGMLRSGDL